MAAGNCVTLVRPWCGLGQIVDDLKINLAEHRIRRKQVLGRLMYEYQVVA
jgi:hypothetical protein